MMGHAARIVAAVAALGGPFSFQADAQNAAKVEILYEGISAATICDARSAIVKGPDFTDGNLSKPDAEIERLSIEPAAIPARQKARIYPGPIGCADDYVWSLYDVPNVPHSILFMFRWPPGDNAEPDDLGRAADVDVAGPGLVFVPPWPSETLQQTRERIPGSTFLMLPERNFYPTSAVRIGTSAAGSPLILTIHGTGFDRTLGIAVIEAGQDPVRIGRPQLSIEGVAARLQAASLSTLSGRPLLSFAYRDPEHDPTSYVLGAADCRAPHAVSVDTVDCQPLLQIRLPFGPAGPPMGPGLDERTRIAVPESRRQAFIARPEGGKTCIATYAARGLEIMNAAAGCALEVAGEVRQLVAVSDSELLVLTYREAFRLFRVSGL